MKLRTVKMGHPKFGIEMEVVPVDELQRLLPVGPLPSGWDGPNVAARDAVQYQYTAPFMRSISVLVTCSREKDRKLWLHVSLAKWSLDHSAKVEPSWSDIRTVKDLFVGRARKALIVLPESANYVNLDEVHHLWCCLDGDGLPDFTQGTGSI